MSDIQHHIGINAPKQAVYEAVSTIDGFRNWWTKTTDGDTKVGGKVDFRFGANLQSGTMKELTPGRHAALDFTQGAADWVGTRMTFDLEEKDGKTLLKFGHRGWREMNDFFGHCSMQWAGFLLSLKQYVEAGKGKPFPEHMVI